MRLAYVFSVLLIMYLTIGIIDNVMDTNLSDWEASVSSSDNKTGISGSTFFNIVFQPYLWKENQWIITLGGILAVSVGIGAVGAYLTKSDIVLLMPFAILLLSIGIYPLISIYSFITRNVGMFACTVGETCTEAWLIGILTAGVMGLFYTLSVLEWWFWRPMTQ